MKLNSFAKFVFFVCLFCLVASNVQAASWCKPDGQAVLSITPKEQPVQYIHDRSFLNLSKVKSDTVNPYARGQISHTFGLAHREFQLDQRVEYKLMTYPRTGEVCLWIDKLDIDVSLKPTIYIAREYDQGSCHFNHVLAHEQEHLRVDREVTSKYLGIIQNKLNAFLQKNRIYGPMRRNLQNALASRMQRDVSNLINDIVKDMEKERAVKQGAIDSLESYEATSRYITNVCDKQHPAIAQKRDKLLRQVYRR